MRPLHILLILSAVSASGCASLGTIAQLPRPVAAPVPVASLPDAFSQTKSLPLVQLSNDTVLQDLLARIPQSPDSAIAQGRLNEARARLAAARAGLLPSLSGTSIVSTTGAKDTPNTNAGSLGTSLEIPIDLFGANRGRVDATRARFEAAAYDKDRTDALTRATLSQLYVALRTAQSQISVTQANQASASESLSLAITRQRAGLETGLGVAQATSNRDAIAARLPAFQQGEMAARLGIEALLGQLPAALAAQLASQAAIPRFDLSRADATPAQWLTGRADLLAAARLLEAAGLEAGAAKRDRYPNLSLNALLGVSGRSGRATGLGGSLTANLVTTLFDFGRLDALADAAGAVAQTQAAVYRQRVTNALADVETQASRVNRGQAAIDANAANIASAADQARLARVRYTSGLSGFLEVLTAQRAVYEAQSAHVAAIGETAAGEVALNLALGF